MKSILYELVVINLANNNTELLKRSSKETKKYYRILEFRNRLFLHLLLKMDLTILKSRIKLIN